MAGGLYFDSALLSLSDIPGNFGWLVLADQPRIGRRTAKTMFSAILIHDNITIAPSKFDRSRLVVLMEEINLKYANKVIPHVGLCVRLLKVESVGEAQVFPSDGSAICEGA